MSQICTLINLSKNTLFPHGKRFGKNCPHTFFGGRGGWGRNYETSQFLLNFLIACNNKQVFLQLLKLHASIQLDKLKYSYLITLFKSLGICAEGFWIGLVSSMRLDGWKDIQSVKSACSVLYVELKTSILPSLKENAKRQKMNSNNNFKNVWAVALH